jgi:hypothetical protein
LLESHFHLLISSADWTMQGPLVFLAIVAISIFYCCKKKLCCGQENCCCQQGAGSPVVVVQQQPAMNAEAYTIGNQPSSVPVETQVSKAHVLNQSEAVSKLLLKPCLLLFLT